MGNRSLDSIKEAIGYVTETLNFNETYLAGFWGYR